MELEDAPIGQPPGHRFRLDRDHGKVGRIPAHETLPRSVEPHPHRKRDARRTARFDPDRVAGGGAPARQIPTRGSVRRGDLSAGFYSHENLFHREGHEEREANLKMPKA